MIESETIEYLKEFANCVDYEFIQKGENPSVVIVGESHGYERSKEIELCQLEKLIVMLKPEFVLIEQLVALAFKPESNDVGFRNGIVCIDEKDQDNLKAFITGDYGDYKDFKNISVKYNIKIIGCDLSEGELCGHGRLDPLISDKRDKKIGKVIINYSKLSSEPHIAFIGHWHARSDSKTREKLDGNIDYICIWDEGAVKKERKEKERTNMGRSMMLS